MTYRVFLDAKPYDIASELPTMSLAELLPKFGVPGLELVNIFMERSPDGVLDRIYLAHASAVDLRNEPRLYVDLPARMGGRP